MINLMTKMIVVTTNFGILFMEFLLPGRRTTFIYILARFVYVYFFKGMVYYNHSKGNGKPKRTKSKNQKTLDKSRHLWYNEYVLKERTKLNTERLLPQV